MRCMFCSEPMAVTAVVPHEAVAGFAYEDLHCPACGATERRLIVERRTATPTNRDDVNLPSASAASFSLEPVTSGKGEPESSGPPAQEESPVSNPLPAAPAWARAVEKVRTRQADLHARSEEAKKADSAAQFNRAWEKLAPTPPQPMPTFKTMPERTWSRRALRAELRKLSRSRAQPQQPAVDANPEARARFNRFWESLTGVANIVAAAADLPAAQATPPSSPVASRVATPVASPLASPSPSSIFTPLPRSLSLVPVESFNTLERLESMSDTTRAILLLTGPKRRAVAGAPKPLNRASRRSA